MKEEKIVKREIKAIEGFVGVYSGLIVRKRKAFSVNVIPNNWSEFCNIIRNIIEEQKEKISGINEGLNDEIRTLKENNDVRYTKILSDCLKIRESLDNILGALKNQIEYLNPKKIPLDIKKRKMEFIGEFSTECSCLETIKKLEKGEETIEKKIERGKKVNWILVIIIIIILIILAWRLFGR